MTLDEIEAAGGYPILYADPPWSYDDDKCGGGVGKEYKTMATTAIGDLPIARLAAKDAVLFIWGTYPKIADLLALIPRWGFTYKSIAFQWVKTRGSHEDGSGKPFLGLGRWTRGNTEPCFLAVRGKPHRVHQGVRQLVITPDEDLVIAPLGKHSAKPPEVRDRIVTLMGDLPRIELFAREKVPGWDAFGNEIESDVTL
jgi:N6-adenosine-specific RNA methylase IME4